MTSRVLLIVLLAIAAGPALRLDCLLSCGVLDSVGVSSCHAASQPDQSIAAAVSHCVTGALPAAVAVKRDEARTLATTLGADTGGTARPPIVSTIGDTLAPLTIPRSLSSHQLPLRI
jgi:hypothetical protein